MLNRELRRALQGIYGEFVVILDFPAEGRSWFPGRVYAGPRGRRPHGRRGRGRPHRRRRAGGTARTGSPVTARDGGSASMMMWMDTMRMPPGRPRHRRPRLTAAREALAVAVAALLLAAAAVGWAWRLASQVTGLDSQVFAGLAGGGPVRHAHP